MVRRLARWSSRVDLYPRLEVAVALLVIVLGVGSYAVLTSNQAPAAGFSPSLVTALLVVNLVPLMALFVLIARRLAILLSNRRRGTAGAHLHVRLVALFATIAAVPTLLVVIFASLLFQFGTQFWFSDRAKTVLDNADQVAQAYVAEKKEQIVDEIIAMSTDVAGYGQQFGYDSKDFRDGMLYQLPRRRMESAAVFSPVPGGYRTYAAVKMDQRPVEVRVRPPTCSAPGSVKSGCSRGRSTGSRPSCGSPGRATASSTSASPPIHWCSTRSPGPAPH